MIKKAGKNILKHVRIFVLRLSHCVLSLLDLILCIVPNTKVSLRKQIETVAEIIRIVSEEV